MGFPPLIAALTCTRDVPGGPRRTDVDAIVRLLLASGADPNQRGINDYTALHMAVAERNALAVQLLLDAGADPDLRTRIDDCETPLEMARAAGLDEIAAVLERRGGPLRRRLRSGLTLLADVTGTGEPVQRQRNYMIRLRLWLRKGEPVRWKMAWGRVGVARLEDNGETLVSEVRIDRRSLVNGLFYGVEGMRVGGNAPARNSTAPRVWRARRSGRHSAKRRADRRDHDSLRRLTKRLRFLPAGNRIDRRGSIDLLRAQRLLHHAHDHVRVDRFAQRAEHAEGGLPGGAGDNHDRNRLRLRVRHDLLVNVSAADLR
jgi:hypothetical protein